MIAKKPFRIIAMTASGLPDPAIAIAACRAGELGVLDLEYTLQAQVAHRSFSDLSNCAESSFGIKLGRNNISMMDSFCKHGSENFRWLVLANIEEKETLEKAIAAAKNEDIGVIVECVSVKQAQSAAEAGADGVIAKGNESGGRVGNESTFILLQRLAKHLSIDVYAQGGIGLRTACAVKAAGAKGVVLDNQLLLARESAVPQSVKKAITSFDGSETLIIGESINRSYHICHRLGNTLVNDHLIKERQALPADGDKDSLRKDQWEQSLFDSIGWHSLDENIYLFGQDIALAKPLADTYVTVGGIVQAMKTASTTGIRTAARLQTFHEGSPLAEAHHTRYPIVQGPMARISETPAFLAEIASAGALPFLAVSWLRAEELDRLLHETSHLLSDMPWGVGLLGFLSPDVYEEQLAIVKKHQPRFALIAGGRPDQVNRLEKEGIKTYVHVPSPELLKLYMDQGLRRFIFEGRESGGHVGPRNSFILWELLIQTFFTNKPSAQRFEDYNILFAGGIHDSLSASMVAALSHELSDSGVRVGVQLGSSYLYTAEAVKTKAIVEDYQKKIIAATGTILLETGGGHANRCIDNPFAQKFLQERRQLLSDPQPHEKTKETLEKMTVGRLRIAAKGVTRKQDSTIGKVDESGRWQEGMYMIGQLAALRNDVTTISKLHEAISIDSQRIVTDIAESETTQSMPASDQLPSDIAIIGMACVFPGASDVEQYWENIINGKCAIREVSLNRWNPDHYYSQDIHAKDKVYSKWGAFIDPILFDPIQFAIVPSSIASIEPLQLIALKIASDALTDAGYATRPFPRERTSVVFGISGTAELGQLYGFRATLPTFLGKDAEKIVSHFEGTLPEWTEDSFPGILMNVTSGRIANRLNLTGTNYTVDAACASSLAAVHLAVKELESKTSDMVIVGGADTMQNPFTYLCFSKTQALSPSGMSRPMDQEADGIVIGEGVVAIVLKRLADAQRDGDRIYAVIKGTGAASDGKGKSLTAPLPDGQIRALERAYSKANIAPKTVGLVEAHATGTPVGDQAEVQGLSTFLRNHDGPKLGCAIGSVKSMIGHTKSSSGIASLVKTALSLHHKILPPSLNVRRPIEPLNAEDSPLYVNINRRPWINPGSDSPRRAGVSAFGFGGTNFHVAMEEYDSGFEAFPKEATWSNWPAEVFLWQATSIEDLIADLHLLKMVIRQNAELALSDLAFSINQRFIDTSLVNEKKNHFRLAIVATTVADALEKVRAAEEKISASAEAIDDRKGIYFNELSISQRPKIAFLFPGQGSQYTGMMADLLMQFSKSRKIVEKSDVLLHQRLASPLSSYIFPPPCSIKSCNRARRKRFVKPTSHKAPWEPWILPP